METFACIFVRNHKWVLFYIFFISLRQKWDEMENGACVFIRNHYWDLLYLICFSMKQKLRDLNGDVYMFSCKKSLMRSFSYTSCFSEIVRIWNCYQTETFACILVRNQWDVFYISFVSLEQKRDRMGTSSHKQSLIRSFISQLFLWDRKETKWRLLQRYSHKKWLMRSLLHLSCFSQIAKTLNGDFCMNRHKKSLMRALLYLTCFSEIVMRRNWDQMETCACISPWEITREISAFSD